MILKPTFSEKITRNFFYNPFLNQSCDVYASLIIG